MLTHLAANTELFHTADGTAFADLIATYGEEVTFGGGKVIRDGQGQSQVSEFASNAISSGSGSRLGLMIALNSATGAPEIASTTPSEPFRVRPVVAAASSSNASAYADTSGLNGSSNMM